MTSQQYPRRVEQNISIQKVDAETLVYDSERHLAFCLDRLASAVWFQCDGRQTAAQIAIHTSNDLACRIGEEVVAVALAQLEQDALLQSANLSYAHLGAISRRSLMGKLGASAVLLLPVVTMIAAPKAAQAYNGCADCMTVQQQGLIVQSNSPQTPAATPTTAPADESIFKP